MKATSHSMPFLCSCHAAVSQIKVLEMLAPAAAIPQATLDSVRGIGGMSMKERRDAVLQAMNEEGEAKRASRKAEQARREAEAYAREAEAAARRQRELAELALEAAETVKDGWQDAAAHQPDTHGAHHHAAHGHH